MFRELRNVVHDRENSHVEHGDCQDLEEMKEGENNNDNSLQHIRLRPSLKDDDQSSKSNNSYYDPWADLTKEENMKKTKKSSTTWEELRKGNASK